MKKILPWLLFLLLLLIIFCVWTKKDSMHLSSDTPTPAVSTPVVVAKVLSIGYVITQQDSAYTLEGNFTNTQQKDSLRDTCAASARELMKKGTATNATLVGDNAIDLTNKILPHFIKNYKNGKIVYENNTLRVYGDVNSYDAQHEMQRLLNTSQLASQDNSNVLIEKPIHYIIKKNLDNVSFSGTFNDGTQIDVLRTKLPASTSTRLTQSSNHVDKGSLYTTANILPSFIEKYNHGSIQYKDETLTVSGTVKTQADLHHMDSLLSSTKIPVINLTTIDQAALAEAEAEASRLADAAIQEKARLAANAEEFKKAQVLRAAQEQAKLDAAAQAEETQKAQDIRATQEQAKLDAAAKVARTEAFAKEKIRKLLSIENIEFEVSKGSLTPRGKSTVDKLANILKQYPDIKSEIAGHTDSDGSTEFNQKLSQSRVDTVKSRLISKGISATRLTAKGYGESKPLVPNTSKANKQRNRRVEINIQGE